MVQQLLHFSWMSEALTLSLQWSSTSNSICKHKLLSILKRPRLFEFSSNLKNCCDIQSFLSTMRLTEFYIHTFFIIEKFLILQRTVNGLMKTSNETLMEKSDEKPQLETYPFNGIYPNMGNLNFHIWQYFNLEFVSENQKINSKKSEIPELPVVHLITWCWIICDNSSSLFTQ